MLGIPAHEVTKTFSSAQVQMLLKAAEDAVMTQILTLIEAQARATRATAPRSEGKTLLQEYTEANTQEKTRLYALYGHSNIMMNKRTPRA